MDLIVPWAQKFVVKGDEVVEVEAYEVEQDGWVVRIGGPGGVLTCVSASVLCDTPDAAAERLRKLGPMPKEIR